MRECSTCKRRHYCQQAFRLRRTLDSNGRVKWTDDDYTHYDYVARAYNHSTKQYVVCRGNIKVKPETRFTVAISLDVRRQLGDNVEFCTEAKQLD